jgi:hypothetical protein
LELGKRLILDLVHQRLRFAGEGSTRPARPGQFGKLVLAREGDVASVEIWAAGGFSLDNHPVRALIDPLYPGTVIASQTIEGLIRPEWHGKRLHIAGVSTSRTSHADRLFSMGLIFVTFAGNTICSSTQLSRYDRLFGILAIPTKLQLGAPFYRGLHSRLTSDMQQCG